MSITQLLAKEAQVLVEDKRCVIYLVQLIIFIIRLLLYTPKQTLICTSVATSLYSKGITHKTPDIGTR